MDGAVTGAVTGGRGRAARRAVTGWWFDPVPLARVARFRALAYLFIPVDVLLTTPWVRGHAHLPPEQYQPLFIARLLHLPTPNAALIYGVMVALLVTAVLAASGRAPRLLGAAVFVLYFEWMVIAMSYGKVDHDRFAFLVALAVLPTVGRAGWRDPTPSESAGWALRMVQVGVVATYFLAAWAKFRYGGLAWLNSATLTWAILRKGTDLSRPLLDHYEVLRASQWGLVAFELLSPVVLFLRRERWRVLAVGVLVGFHVMTWLMIRIIFLPHVVCLAAFLPLERLRLPHRAFSPSSPRQAPSTRCAPASARGAGSAG